MTPDRMAAIHAAAMRTGRAWSVNEFRTTLAMPGAVSAFAEDAFAVGRVTLDEAELLTIAVDPALRRRGLGRTCLSRFHMAARKMGAVSVFLEVAETNAAARALYAGAGYIRVGRRDDYYCKGQHALVLRLDLTA